MRHTPQPPDFAGSPSVARAIPGRASTDGQNALTGQNAFAVHALPGATAPGA